MGLVLNRQAPLTLQELAEGQSLEVLPARREQAVYLGGPVEPQRGFVLHDRGGRGPAVHARIAEVLRDSVAKHMRADVTVGAFLSGGIDSTAIAALAKEHNPDLVTFTTGFEREGYSEVDVAAESAAAIGVRHVVRTVKPDEMMDVLPLIVWYLDDPVADPALVTATAGSGVEASLPGGIAAAVAAAQAADIVVLAIGESQDSAPGSMVSPAVSPTARRV